MSGAVRCGRRRCGSQATEPGHGAGGAGERPSTRGPDRAPLRSAAIPEIRVTAGSPVPHAQGTTRAASPTVREALGSGRGSRSPKRETPGRGSITIRKVTDRHVDGKSRARDSPHRVAISTSRMAGPHVRCRPQRRCGPMPGRWSPSPWRCASEGLALPGVRRSHRPLGKGGSRCVA